MFDLANKFWDWKSSQVANKPLKTEQGYKVMRFGESFAVRAYPGHYYDLKGSWKWSHSDTYFRDCLGSRDEIENRFGKILGLEDD